VGQRFVAQWYQAGEVSCLGRSQNYSKVLELGCGTGVVGLTCAKLNLAESVTLTDSEPSLWPILRNNIQANSIRNDAIRIHELDWRDTTTFLSVGQERFDMILAADVLYSGMDKLFARALASHLPSEEVDYTTPCGSCGLSFSQRFSVGRIF
jgi:predicted O-methyltransferase YrrM